MTWVVGIDEAGYGPNLGPLVQAAVALRLPDNDRTGWSTLSAIVRRACENDDGRLLIDDSKKVYAGARGFEKLEQNVRRAFGLPDGPINDRAFTVDTEDCERSVLKSYSPWVRVRIVEPRDFNAIVDRTGTKAAVLSSGLIELMNAIFAGLRGSDALCFICDKQGGRNFYAPFLQQVFPDGWIVADQESAAESRYRVIGLSREVTVSFRPKADGESVCVALASMVCKLLREIRMKSLNEFWQTQVPNLIPTAGYPVDAKRFYSAIQPAMARLGIEPDSVWRKK